MALNNVYADIDIPSHIMREPHSGGGSIPVARYTLTYNEGTSHKSLFTSSKAIYPHI